MALRRLFSLTLAAAGLVLALVALGLVLTHPAARALPPAGTDNVYVTADVSVASRIGTETIHVTGTATIVRQDPHLESGREVEDLRITSLDLAGNSMEGPITVSQSATTNSTGQIRSINLSPSQFPASSFFDVFFEAAIPASGFGSPSPFIVHNEVAIHLAPMSGGSKVTISAWPPFGVTYQMQLNQLTPTATATSTPTATPGAPPGTPPCTNGIRLFPELPGEICVTAVSLTLSVPPTPTPSPTLTPTATPCVPTCTPTPTSTAPAATPTRTPFPSPTPTHTPGPFVPADTVFSVGAHGPSGFHPADLLARGPSTVPIAVSGNDNFVNAWQISGSPFSGTESTVGMTTEQGEPLTVAPAPLPPGYCIPTSPNYMGSTVWFRFSPSASGTMQLDTFGSDYDTVLAAYTGSALNSLTLVGCNDDSTECSCLQSSLSFSASAGTTYYIQAGGFAGAAGNLILHVTGPGGSSVSGVHVAISCAALGLSAAGCGATGVQDNVDALSFGHDFGAGTAAVWFSVAPGSTGMTGSGVALEAACSPPEPQADVFSSNRDGTNSTLVDGDASVADCPPSTAPGLNLTEGPASEILDAISGAPISVVDTNGDGRLDNPVFFALSQGSPSLATLGRGPADILWTVGGFRPGLYASAADLGLRSADGIDGICVSHPGAGATYDPAHDQVLFSLAPGSPTLAALGASPADVLAPGPKIAIHAWELGLRSTDNLDALHCFTPSGGATVTVPVGDFYFCDASYQGGVCDTVVHVGDTVTWNFVQREHTTTECGPSCDNPVPLTQALWDSGSPPAPTTFSHVFTTPGTYLYYCRIHPTAQRGRIIVQAAGNPTPTPTPARRYGDANKDGIVDAVDAALVLQYSAGLLLSINQNADANGDGQINPIDATLILQYVAGLINHLPP